MYTQELKKIRGHEHIKRLLEVAVAGEHSVALHSVGNPLDTELFAFWLNEHNIAAFQVPHCPCGNLGSVDNECICSRNKIKNFQEYGYYADARLAAELHIDVHPVPYEKLSSERDGETDEMIVERALAARERTVDLTLDNACRSLMQAAHRQLGLNSNVQYRRVLKVAATIAKLAGAATISPAHLAEALQYRPRDMWK